MSLTIKYSGYIADVTGKQEEEISILDSLENLDNYLKAQYNSIFRAYFMYAINGKMCADMQTKLQDKDVVLLLCPFAGG